MVYSPPKHAGMAGCDHSDPASFPTVSGQSSGTFGLPDPCLFPRVMPGCFVGNAGVHVGTLPFLCSARA